MSAPPVNTPVNVPSWIDQLATQPQRTAADPTTSAWVGANAGTGKTKVLTDRVLNLLLAGTAPERVLCLTFTKAAAAEMSTRLAKRLSGWAVCDDETLDSELNSLGVAPSPEQRNVARRLFARLLDVPGGMRIETIHAFCQSLLRRFPLEAGISPHFDVLDDRGAKELMDQAYERLLRLARNSEGGALANALAVITANLHESRFADRMRELTSNRGRLAHLFGGKTDSDADARQRLYDRLGLPVGTSVAVCVDRGITLLRAHPLESIAHGFGQGGKKDQDSGRALVEWLALPADQQNARWKDLCDLFLTKEGEPRSTKTWPSKSAKDADPGLLEAVERMITACLRLSEQVKAAQVAEATDALLLIGRTLLEGYQAAKSQRGVMDFDDLIQTAKDLLNSQENTAWVLYKLDGGIDHVMIDEAQDTGPDQWAVISRLTEDFLSGEGAHPDRTRTVFVVGDRKQSIYSFQGADPRAFDRMYSLYRDKHRDAIRRFENVAMTVSFRSVPAILRVVDQVFADGPAAVGVKTDSDPVSHRAAREGMAGTVELWPTMPPLALGDGDHPWKPPIEAIRGESAQTRLARLLAKRIRRMITHETLPSRDRTIRPGDILVLVRRRGGFVEDLVRALKAEKIPVSGADRMVLTNQIVVMDLLALGQTLLLPEDDLTLACVLKSPLFGLSEEALYGVAQGRRKGQSLWWALREAATSGRSGDHAPLYTQAYNTLRGLMERADFLPPHELYAHILGAFGGRKKLLARLGPDAEDPLDEFMQLTLAYDRGHPPSLQNFLHWITSDDGQLKRDLDERGDMVRVMTVHGSKGLQAPVVIMPDTTSPPKAPDGVLWDDDQALMLWAPSATQRCQQVKDLLAEKVAAEHEEYRRLLYVGMTRAEDHLILCGWSGKKALPEDCWYNLVAPVVQDLGVKVEDPILTTEGPALGLETGSIWRYHTAQEAQPKADRQQTALEDEADSAPAWMHRPPPAEPMPPRPLAPSRIELPDPPPRSPLDRSDRLDHTQDQTRRFQRGTLIHRLLQSLPDLPAAQRAAAAEVFLARPVWSLPTATQAALTRETLAVMENPAFAGLFGPQSLAEVPITGVVGGMVVSGQVDRLVIGEDQILIVDYKTNRPPPTEVADVAPAYLLQMALYRAVLQQIYPNVGVRCALLWTDGPRMMDLPAEALEAQLQAQGLA